MTKGEREDSGDMLHISATEDRRYNRRIQIANLVREILGGSPLTTMAEAVVLAENILAKEGR